MEKLKPLSEHASLETCRRSQDILGSILAKTMRSNVDIHDAKLSNCEVAWIYPHDELKKRYHSIPARRRLHLRRSRIRQRLWFGAFR